jgi:hypothetical protein
LVHTAPFVDIYEFDRTGHIVGWEGVVAVGTVTLTIQAWHLAGGLFDGRRDYQFSDFDLSFLEPG